MTLRHLASFSIALLTVVGCNNVERDLVTAYAWSDDDTRHVYARSQWKFQMAALPDGRNREEHNNARFTILAQSPDGSNRVTLVPWRGGGANVIYDMRQAGYVMARVDTGRYADNQEYTLFFDDGRIAKLDYFENNPYCGFYFAIPSPDGATIAILKQVAPAGQAPERLGDPCPRDLESTITFIDAASQDQVDQVTYTAPQGGAFQWDTRGYLVYENDGWKAWRGPGDVVSTPETNCYDPRTTSSYVSAAGVVVETGPDVESQPLQIADWTRTGFGCE